MPNWMRPLPLSVARPRDESAGRVGFLRRALGKRPARVPWDSRLAGNGHRVRGDALRVALPAGDRSADEVPVPRTGAAARARPGRGGPGDRRGGVRPRSPAGGARPGAAGPGRVPVERDAVPLRAVGRGLREAHRSAARWPHLGRDASATPAAGEGASGVERLSGGSRARGRCPDPRRPGGSPAGTGAGRERRAAPAGGWSPTPGTPKAGREPGAAMLLSSRVPAILGSRPMAGHTALDRGIGVRVPASQPAGRGGAATSRASSEVPRPNPAAGEGETS